eukprot:7614104-Pyramimonas_sp.AAC.1
MSYKKQSYKGKERGSAKAKVVPEGKRLIDYDEYKTGSKKAWKPELGKKDVMKRCKDLNRFLDDVRALVE